MMNKQELKENRQLINEIDWGMTPEKAIEMYLEWGTGWIRGNDFVSSADQESYYFVVYDWEDPPQVTLIHRTVEGAEDIAKVEVPANLFIDAAREDGYKPGVGVHPLHQPLQEWVSKALNAVPY
ncbi:MAG: hypothetical protein KJ950_09190 [Proteobacteria bacterium]|nr:hypothetical protein [Pseudomonadota bacterium]MBU1687671.1 hypothetical protein [Pseudomonadota bacterium]